jgi:hypothetical protein
MFVASVIETGHESIRRDLVQAVRVKAAPFGPNACFSHCARNEQTVERPRLSMCADIDEVW